MGVTRKTVLFIVEGPSDKAALEKIFQTIYRRNKDVEFKFTEGDITSDPNLEEILDSTNSYEQVWKIDQESSKFRAKKAEPEVTFKP